MILYCVRHGESVYNAEGRIQGRLNVPLSELGRRQSAAAAAALASLSADALYASPLRRAMETAEIIADALGLPIQDRPPPDGNRRRRLPGQTPLRTGGTLSRGVGPVERRRPRFRHPRRRIAAAVDRPRPGSPPSDRLDRAASRDCCRPRAAVDLDVEGHFGHPVQRAALLLAEWFDHHAFGRRKWPLQASLAGSGRSFCPDWLFPAWAICRRARAGMVAANAAPGGPPTPPLPRSVK